MEVITSGNIAIENCGFSAYCELFRWESLNPHPPIHRHYLLQFLPEAYMLFVWANDIAELEPAQGHLTLFKEEIPTVWLVGDTYRVELAPTKNPLLIFPSPWGMRTTAWKNCENRRYIISSAPMAVWTTLTWSCNTDGNEIANLIAGISPSRAMERLPTWKLGCDRGAGYQIRTQSTTQVQPGTFVRSLLELLGVATQET